MLMNKVEKALDRVRPALQADGGDVELISVDESIGKVVVRLQGSCHGCPMAQLTLKHSVERIIKEEVPEVKIVEAEQ
jgi:Fe-S cluster biogenesis protein NfuA